LTPRIRFFDDSIILLVLALTAACAVALIHISSLSPLRVVFDYNEGWNAYHAAAAMSGNESLYPGPNSLMPNNYPPLSFYIIGGLGRITGDYVVAGRIISLLATISIAGAVTYIARQMGCAAIEACFAALIFLAMMLASTTYVGMDDPQLLAHAIGCAGFS
jgi:4-amino-4-deoxy-L-arabinose transferase-like glycosyltransferase